MVSWFRRSRCCRCRCLCTGQVLPGPMCSTLTGPFCNVEYWSSNSSCHGCASCYNCNNCTLCATPPGVWTADFAAVKGPALKRGKCGSAVRSNIALLGEPLGAQRAGVRLLACVAPVVLGFSALVAELLGTERAIKGSVPGGRACAATGLWNRFSQCPQEVHYRPGCRVRLAGQHVRCTT